MQRVREEVAKDGDKQANKEVVEEVDKKVVEELDTQTLSGYIQPNQDPRTPSRSS